MKFAYAVSTLNDSVRLNFEIENATLKELLDRYCRDANLKYAIFGNQILLKKDISRPVKYLIKGAIYEAGTERPVSYATVSVRNHQIGCISDINGSFELVIGNTNLKDSLHFSSMGFEPITIPVKEFMQYREKLIYLNGMTYEIPPAHVSSRNFKKVTMGNSRKLSSGSLYMDTNGQQAALFIDNDKGINGKILSVNYYLSVKGNTNAPFRVRIYRVDSLTGMPGSDLLGEMVVVKPDIRRGLYSVDVGKFDIMVPENGFYIAMEGVFPNDYEFYTGSSYFVDLSAGDKVDIIDDDQSDEITYGQRLGFTKSRKDKNNTWHYSLSHTWFQLKKQPFGIMVSADIQIRKNNDKKGERQ